MLATERSSLNVSQSLSKSFLFISESDCNANCLSFALNLTVMSIIKLFSISEMTYNKYILININFYFH